MYKYFEDVSSRYNLTFKKELKMIVEAPKKKISVAEKLDALKASFSDQTLNIANVDQSRVDSIAIAPPITAWNWSKSFEK
ncbi:darobactin family peptide antibiotic, partial [Pseudoalteromonas sp. DL2-H6]|uniref:darobactin family peptide antibiotic n=2 Tax=Pseudoalteromonas TaxID=53246 RepID=UPI001F3741ED